MNCCCLRSGSDFSQGILTRLSEGSESTTPLDPGSDPAVELCVVTRSIYIR